MEVPSSDSLFSRIKNLFSNRQHRGIELPVSEEESHYEVINNLEDYFDMTIREVMVPRTKMVTIDTDEPLKNAITLFHQTGYSRLPVEEGERDNIVGILYANDIFGYFDRSDEIRVRQIMRKPLFVSYSQKIHQVLTDFRKNRVQLAIVVDEHGGVDGLVTTGDVIEELVGDIPDEFNKIEDPGFKKLDDKTILMDANYPLDDFNELYDTDFQKEGIETIGGYICHSAGKILEKGEEIELEHLRFFADESSERQLEKLKITSFKA